MQITRIKQLIELLPQRHRFAPLGTSHGYHFNSDAHFTSAVDLLANTLYDPRFGFRFICTFLERDLPLPAEVVTDEYLFRLDGCLRYGERDEVIIRALCLDHPSQHLPRALLKALLLRPELTLEAIAEIFKVDTEVITAYDQLFWNVRDRMTDKMYLSMLVYPKGRMAELQENYLQTATHEEQLLCTAFHGDLDAVFDLAGFRPRRSPEDMDTATFVEEFERRVLANGHLLAQLGLLNQKNLPGLQRAMKFILQHKKAVRPVVELAHDFLKLESMPVSLGTAMMEEIKRTRTVPLGSRAAN